MARIAIYSHAPSDTVNLLKEHMATQGVDLVKIKRTNTRFVGRRGDLIVNYGSSQMPTSVFGAATVLNRPEIISRGSNKLDAFRLFESANVKTVPWTADNAVAQQWLSDGALVYARTRLQGHSGEGIVLAFNNPAGVGDAGDVQVTSTLPRASLYTKAIMSERREFRIHVMNGKITYVQQKKRRDGYREMEGFSNLVRNFHTGWIYATQMAELNDEAKREALKAINALGLDYGAVDVITRRDEAWVLEVNTAPGMTGTNLETFAANLVRLSNGEEVQEVMAAPSLANLQEEVQRESTTPARQRNQSSSRSIPDVDVPAARAERAPAPQAASQAPQATPAPAQPAATSRRASGTGTLTANGVYLLEVSGERTVGKYDASMRHFEIIGWEVPVEAGDATVVEQLCVL